MDKLDIFDLREYAMVNDRRNLVIEPDPAYAREVEKKVSVLSVTKYYETTDGTPVVDRYSPCYDGMTHEEVVSRFGMRSCKVCSSLLTRI